MSITKKCLFLLITGTLVLSGCGGSETNEDKNDSAIGNAYTVKAIDGYLIDAEVYIDRNDDMVSDTDELVGVTDSNGEFVISAFDSTYSVIIRAVGGTTSDLDTGGRVHATYEMVSSVGGELYVTPFSTLAAVQGITTVGLAASLGFDAELIAGDYVAAKTDNDTAKEVHLLARSTVKLLSGSIVDTAANSELMSSTESLILLIVDKVNQGADLDEVLFEDGADIGAIPTVESWLSGWGRDHTRVSLNSAEFDKYGFEWIEITQTEEHFNIENIHNYDGTRTTYNAKLSATGNTLTEYDRVGNSSYPVETYEFIYSSQTFALVVNDRGHIELLQEGTDAWSAYLPLAREEYAGKSMYWIYDNNEDLSDNTPDWGTITFDFAEGDAGYYVDDAGGEGSFTWGVGELGVEGADHLWVLRDGLNSSGDPHKTWAFRRTENDKNMSIVDMYHYDNPNVPVPKYASMPMFLIMDKGVAEGIVAESYKKLEK